MIPTRRTPPLPVSRRALTIAVIYATLAGLWIYSSDALLGLLITDAARFALASTYKGWVFVVVTSALLYSVLRATPQGVSEESSEPTPFRIWPPLLIFALFAGAVATTGFLVYRGIARAATDRAENTLEAVANLKTQQVADWLRQSRWTAERLSHNTFLAPATAEWLARGAPADAVAERIRRRLEGLRTSDEWDGIHLVDRNGMVRIDLRDRADDLAESRDLAMAAMESRNVVFRDIHRTERGEVELAYFVPLLVSDAAGERAVAAIGMQLDPTVHLLPLVKTWPFPTRTGEAMLVRSDGGGVVDLTDLRDRNRAPLSPRLPLTQQLLVEARARAMSGGSGAIEGVDYRQVPVLASARRVPGSDWVVIAKMDIQEINGPVENSARLLALFGIVLVLAAGIATVFWLRRQRALAWIREYRAERERSALTRQLDHLTRHANDIILLMDGEGRILDANERAVVAYGRTREELIGFPIESLRPASELQSFREQWQRARQQPDGIVFETTHQRKDGTVFPVEVSSRAIAVEGNLLRQSIIRDITERKEAEQKIRRLTNIYAALSQINQAIVRGRSRQELFGDFCRLAVDFGGFEFAWVGLVDADTGMVELAASHGADRGYTTGIAFSSDPERPSGQGPMAIAIRERRTYVCTDIDSDPATVPLRERASTAGFRAVAAFPLACEGSSIGALAVYASDARFFDSETIALLEEMASDVSFALDSIAVGERRAAAEEALRESEEKYRLLFDNEHDAIVVFDAATLRVVDANDAFLAMTGDTREEVLRRTIEEISPEPKVIRDTVREVLENGSARVDARRFRRRNGPDLWIEAGLDSFVWRGRQLISAIVRDVTERKSAEERARLWANVLENSAEAIMITDAERRIVQVNEAFTTVTGFAAQDAIGRDPAMLASTRHDETFYDEMWKTIADAGRWAGEVWLRRSNGDIYPGWLSFTAVHDVAGLLTHHVGVFSDITERKESAERIHFLANHDSLTGLPNRSVMNDLVQQSIAASRRKGSTLALLFLDLDRFKTINDSLGHPVGDGLLQQVATRLRASIREEDSVARLGGDEFLILLPELNQAKDAALVAEKILAALREPMIIDEHNLRMTASVGISICPDDATEVTSLIKNADAAMYHAKERGRNNYQFFTSDMNARASESLAMEMSLRAAVQRDEFTLHYQPQVDSRTGRIVAAEALIRWNHPELGSISPAGFIPIAEEHGLIVSIGEWVLRTACNQIRSWLDAGLEVVPIAANMSAVHFRQPGLPARIRTILDESGIQPRYLELELTESIIMRDAEQMIAVLEELSGMGLSLSIDDFGTGYSSLSYLRRFPIDRLKIDQSFVRDITTNPDAAAIAAAIIGMGRSMKLRVVAEGVETAEQLSFLISERCDELQGFHIARPMEAERLAVLLARRHPLINPEAATA